MNHDEIIITSSDEVIRSDSIQKIYNNWVYAPYVPLIVTSIIPPEDFAPRKVKSEHKVTKFLKKLIRT